MFRGFASEVMFNILYPGEHGFGPSASSAVSSGMSFSTDTGLDTTDLPT